MPFGIRPSNVRVCHSTTRAFEFWNSRKIFRQSAPVGNLVLLLVMLLLLLMIVIERNEHNYERGCPDVKSTDQ